MDKLGIEPVLLAAQVVNFFIILVLLKKYLYKPILGIIEKRKKEIAEGVAMTAKMREEEEKLKIKEEKALAKAREEALSIIEAAKKQAKDVEKDLVARAHVTAESILSRAKEEAAHMQTEGAAAMRKQAIEIGVLMAQRLLSSVMSAKEQHSVLVAHAKDLEKWAAQLEA